MTFPDRILPASGGLGCLELERQWLSGIASSHCDVHRDMLAGMSVVDIFAFCGCEGTYPSNNCSLCESSSAMVLEDPVAKGQRKSTCGEITVAARYVVDPNYCQHIQLFAGDCCDVVDEVLDLPQIPCSFCDDDDIPMIKPDQGIPSKKEFTCTEAREVASFFLAESDKCKGEFASWAQGCCKPADRCSLCADPSSTILYPDRQLPFSQEGLTCIDVEFGLGYLKKDECKSFHNSTSSIDVSAWCGCEDAIARVPSCSLCGDFDVVEDYQIPDAPIGITCQTLSEWAPYIKDSATCETRISLLRSECCSITRPEYASVVSSTSEPIVGLDTVSSGETCFNTIWLASLSVVFALAQVSW